jgi:hypothetical protein
MARSAVSHSAPTNGSGSRRMSPIGGSNRVSIQPSSTSMASMPSGTSRTA